MFCKILKIFKMTSLSYGLHQIYCIIWVLDPVGNGKSQHFSKCVCESLDALMSENSRKDFKESYFR